MEGKRLSDDSVLKTDPRYRKLEHLIQVRFIHIDIDKDRHIYKYRDRKDRVKVL